MSHKLVFVALISLVGVLRAKASIQDDAEQALKLFEDDLKLQSNHLLRLEKVQRFLFENPLENLKDYNAHELARMHPEFFDMIDILLAPNRFVVSNLAHSLHQMVTASCSPELNRFKWDLLQIIRRHVKWYPTLLKIFETHDKFCANDAGD